MKRILTLILIASLLLVGCEKLNQQKKVISPVVDNTSSVKETHIEQPLIELEIVRGEYRAIWKRSYNYDKPMLIDNLIHWKEFLKNYPAQFTNRDVLQQDYNDDFFKHSVVYAYIKSEGSGSIKLKVKRAELYGDKLRLFMERSVPEIGTADMATRICLFGIKKDKIKNVKAVEAIILE
ncbi:MAG: hypothetical protein WA118_04125 [Carboxydocellales bacterium]